MTTYKWRLRRKRAKQSANRKAAKNASQKKAGRKK
jgi:hypothetical protein